MMVWVQIEFAIEEDRTIRMVSDNQRRPFKFDPARKGVIEGRCLRERDERWELDPRSLHGSMKITVWSLPVNGDLLFEQSLDITSWAHKDENGEWFIDLERILVSR